MFWKRKSRLAEPSAGLATIPDGQRVYAIGDIHGRDDLFERLIGMIRADNAARAPAHVTLVLLGDLIDRGPCSSDVVARAISLSKEFPDTRLLIGNHEECFLAALTGSERRLRYFMRIGGEATVRSYWTRDDDLANASFAEVAERLPQLVPAAHVEFLGNGEDVIVIGGYAFVHAGIRPGIPLEKQSLSDLRWIREEFLDDMSDHGKVIVHGHSITDQPDEQANRIGIDTGAFQSGVLAALGLEGSERWFLLAQKEEEVVRAVA